VNYENVLNKLSNNEISLEDAYKDIYKAPKIKPGKKAFFVKMSIKVPEEGKGVNRLLKVLFAIPIPIMFARIGLRFAGRFIKDDDFDVKEISQMLKYSRNTRVQVESKDAEINIRIV